MGEFSPQPVYKWLFKRTPFSICLHASVVIHSWIFIGCNSNAEAQAIRSERAEVLQALAYARRAGIDVSAYEQTLKEPPFEPGLETKPNKARLVQSRLAAMLAQINEEIAYGNPDLVAENKDGILIMDSGANNTQSHAMLVKPDGTVKYTIDKKAKAIDYGRKYVELAEESGQAKISPEIAAQLFELVKKSKIQNFQADEALPDREDGNYFVNQTVYVDYGDASSQNLLCTSNPEGKKLLRFCRQISAQIQIDKLSKSS